ncbi:MAG TPA: glutamate decarboxylase [Chlamydiales bacterium]|nr:glutamate decarboxylase [Chlamydiales bacterium]HPE85202.1 glutamate decarboxylase [Chlamydiales bacterium]
MLSKKQVHETHAPVYGGRFFSKALPKHELNEESISPRAAYQLIKDDLSLDGKATLNLASFNTTWMEPEAEKLIMESLNKNFVDADEYPQSQVIEQRCVNILARLFNCPEDENFVGTATIGSSEAIMLAGLAHKWNWREEKKRTGMPNIVMSTGVQVVWHKFARYFDVEEKLVPMKPGCYTLPPEELENYVDENTICVVGILGITLNGQFDPIEKLALALRKLNKKNGWNVPIHVDAASGGFIAPFIYPDLVWDFRIPEVKSINVSGHKFGLVYPGSGWALWRDESLLPQDLIFHLNYLGGSEPTFTLNFSRGSSHIIAQYYNFLRLGVEGYTKIMQSLLDNAHFVSKSLADSGHFEMISDHKSLPVIAARGKGVDVFALSSELRKKGWMVPAYTMPPSIEDVSVIRIVVREGFSRDLAISLVADIMTVVKGQEKTEKDTSQNHVC